MNVHRTTDKPDRRQWISIDLWLRRYDQRRDPYGTYSTPGRNPASVITVERAA